MSRNSSAASRRLAWPLPTLQVVRVIGGRRIIRVDCEYRDPNVSVFLDGRAWHAQSVEKVMDDLEIRNMLEAKGVCVLEYTYRDVMGDFDRIADELRTAVGGGVDDQSLDLASLPGFVVREVNRSSRRAAVKVNANSLVADEASRVESLRSANRARLAGWRLRRIAD